MAMSLLDRFFVGRVIKSFLLEERSLGLGKISKSLLIVERNAEVRLAFKWSGFFLFLGSVQYFDFPYEMTATLRKCLDEADGIVKQRVGHESHLERPD